MSTMTLTNPPSLVKGVAFGRWKLFNVEYLRQELIWSCSGGQDSIKELVYLISPGKSAVKSKCKGFDWRLTMWEFTGLYKRGWKCYWLNRGYPLLCGSEPRYWSIHNNNLLLLVTLILAPMFVLAYKSVMSHVPSLTPVILVSTEFTNVFFRQDRHTSWNFSFISSPYYSHK